MKNSRKIISIILTLCMVMQILPVLAEETQAGVAEINYIINDNFSKNDLNGWTLVKDEGHSSLADDLAYVSAVDGEDGNYMLNYSSVDTVSAQYTHIKRTLPKSVELSEDKNVVIETRMKTTGTNRAYLKYNLVTYPKCNNEWNYCWGMLVGTEGNKILVPNGWKMSASTQLYSYITSKDTEVSDFANKWLNYKIVIKGGDVDTATHTATGNKIYVTVTDDNNNVIVAGEETSLDFPDESDWLDNNTKEANFTDYNWVEDALNTLDFRLRDAETLSVDYIRVYEQYDADINVDAFIVPGEDITVTVDTAEGSALFKDAFVLYDEDGEVVNTTNSIDSTNKIVTLSPVNKLTAGEKYTVKLNNSAISANYSFTTTEKTFTVSDVKYILYDEFGNNDLNGWEQTTYGSYSKRATVGTEDIGNSNYAMTYESTTATAAASSQWTYEYMKKTLDGDGYEFKEGVDTVIKTRVKQNNTGRAFLKFNAPLIDSTDAWNKNWGTLFGNEEGHFFTPSGYNDSGSAYLSYWEKEKIILDIPANTWYEVEVTIHGNTKTASYKVTPEGGETQSLHNNMSIDNPDAANMEEDFLKYLVFRLRAAEKLWVDYVKVYEQYDADIKVDAFIRPDEAVVVTVDAKEVTTALKDAFELYDASGVKVTTSNTVDTVNKTVTLAHGGLTDGEKYTVKVNESAAPANYAFAATEKTFTVADVKYILYDEFGENDLNGWTMVKDAGKTTNDTTTLTATPITDESGNYALEYVSAGTKAADWQYNYITKDLAEPVEFDKDKEIVIETRMKAVGDGRVYLKYNLVTYPNLNHEWNYWWGALLGSDSGEFYVPNGWSGTDNTYSSNPLNTAWNKDAIYTDTTGVWYTYKFVVHGGEINTETHTATGNTMDVTVTDNSGEVVANLKGLSMDFPDNSTWTQANYETAENVNWVEDALNSLDFRLRLKETLYVDYVKVYEQKSADMLVDAFMLPGEAVKVTVDADEGSKAFKDAFVLYNADGEVVNTTNSIDSTNKVVTLVPENEIALGEKYTVKLNKSAVPANYAFTATEKTFTVADAKYILYDEFGANNDLNGWEPKSFEGKNSTNTAVTEPIEENSQNYVLKYSAADQNNSYYGYLSKSVNPVEFSTKKDIIIETKVKDTKGSAGKGRFFIKYNLDGTAYSANEWQHSWGELICVDEGTVFVNNGWKANASGLNANNIKSTDISVAGGWHTYKIIIHGGETKDDATADYIIYNAAGAEILRNEGITLNFPDNSDWVNVGTETGATNASWVEGVLNSVDFRLRNANELYIDYVKVYQANTVSVAVDTKEASGNAKIGVYFTSQTAQPGSPDKYVALYKGDEKVDAVITKPKVGKALITPVKPLELGEYTVKIDKSALLKDGYALLNNSEFAVNIIASTDVNEDFEGMTTENLSDNGWYFREDGLTNVEKTAEIVTEDNNSFLRLTVNKDVTTGDGKLVTYSKNLTNAKFARDMTGLTVMELKLRTNLNTLRKYFKYNYPTSGNINTNAYNEYGWNTRVGAVMDAGGVYVAYKDFRGNGPEYKMQGAPENVSAYETAKWYTIKTVFDNANAKATSYVYNSSDELIGTMTEKDLTAWWFNYYDYERTVPQVMHTIEDITFQFRPESNNVTVTNEQLDIDDIKIYNYTPVDEGATIAYKSNGAAVDAIVEGVTSVTPEFTIQTKDNETAEYYIIAAKYDDGKLISTQIKDVSVTGSQTVSLDAIAVDATDTGLAVKAFVWNKNMVPVCKTGEIKPKVYTIYMATYGNDANAGYESAPVATLNRAIELANNAKTNGYSTSEVIVADGNYELTGETIEIGANLNADSLTVRAENKGKAKFVNGIVFNISDAEPAPDEVKARLSEQSVKDNLYMIDLTKKVDLDKIPGVSLPGPYSYSAHGLETADGSKFVIDESRDPTCEMIFNDTIMTVARYPDNEYETLTDGGFTYNVNSRTRYWMDDAGSDLIEKDDRVTDGFTITLDRAKNWGAADQALMFGYWRWDWATQTVPVAKNGINATKGVITSKYPSHYGLLSGQRYYVYNLLEEITLPNEYFIDRNTGIMYFYKDSAAKAEDEIIMSLYENEIFDITASNITIDGLTITASRGAAVSANGDKVVIKNCEISATAGNAVDFSGTNSVIEYCNIHDVDGGIKLSGGVMATLTPGNNKALNNTITNFSRLSKTYTDAIEVSGVGNKASHNTISDGEHLAMRFSGVDNEISYNEISNVLKETDEAGAIYAGRSWTSRGNVVMYNYFHDLASTEKTTMPICGIMLDDHFSDVTIYGNIFSNVSGYGIKGTGRDLVISNNIFEACASGTIRLTDASGNAASYPTHIKNIAKYYGNATWFSRFGTALFTADGESYNPELLTSANVTYTNNFATGMSIGAEFGTATEASGTKEPNIVLAITNPLKGNYENNGTAIKAHLENFDEIPFAQIGINGTVGRE